MKNNKKYSPFVTICLFLLVALSVQGCFGIGDSSGPSGKTITTNSGGNKVTIAQNLFKGKIYLTIDHNLWAISGNNNATELLHSNDIYDPAVSPDGKWITFAQKFKDYSKLDVMSSTGGPVKTLLDGSGHFYNDTGVEKNTYFWFMRPEWSLDGSHILFLSDLQKNFVWSVNDLFRNNYFLDLQVFSIPFNNPAAMPQALAYASFGDGGDADASFQPVHSGTQQIAYTHYAYDAQTGTQQVIQIFMADANAIANHPGLYTPLQDSGVALTPPTVQNIEPAFSPDGKSIAYIRRETTTQMGLWIMAVPPSTVTTTPNDPTTAKQAISVYFGSMRILGALYLSQPVWSPDGKQIAFFEYTNSEFDLWVVNVNHDAKTGKYTMQGSPQQLTTGGVDGSSRAFWTN